MTLVNEIVDGLKKGEVKIYPKNEFKKGRLLRDIPSIYQKGKKYDKNSEINILPNGIYIIEGQEIRGWFKDEFELVEGTDYVIEGEL